MGKTNVTVYTEDVEIDRPGFTTETSAFFGKTPEYQNLCHSVSYNYISNWVKEINNNNSTDIAKELITTLTNIIFKNDSRFAIFFDNARFDGTDYSGLKEYPAEKSQEALDLLFGNKDGKGFENYINLMNSAIPNLRWGYAQWNKGIKDCFDPDGWIHTDSHGQIDVTFNGIGDIYTDINKDIGEYIQFDLDLDDLDYNAFYLVSAADCLTVKLIKENILPFVDTDFEIIANSATINEKTVNYIQSSSNGMFCIPNKLAISSSPSNIYYYDVDADDWVDFQS
ncbi:MAG: hypothetical protein LBM93_05930 [Oscillospiraceae bacterium]|jgi:hypothetical protein|nr:hypothetical protein [Oscillospiraceae bacterium]